MEMDYTYQDLQDSALDNGAVSWVGLGREERYVR